MGLIDSPAPRTPPCAGENARHQERGVKLEPERKGDAMAGAGVIAFLLLATPVAPAALPDVAERATGGDDTAPAIRRYWYQTLIADGAALGIGGYAFSRRGDPYSGDAVSPARLFGTLAHRSVGLPGSGGVGARRCRTNRPRRRLRQRGCRRAYGDGHRCRRPSASTFLEVLSHTSLQQSQGRFGTTTTNPVAPAIDRSSGSQQRGRVRGSHPALWAC